MLQEQLFLNLGVRPGPSSQTTMDCWSSTPVEGERIIVDSPSFHAGTLAIQPPREAIWDGVIEQVLKDRAEAWERLAEL